MPAASEKPSLAERIELHIRQLPDTCFAKSPESYPPSEIGKI